MTTRDQAAIKSSEPHNNEVLADHTLGREDILCGGQGRTEQELEESTWILFTCFTIVCVMMMAFIFVGCSRTTAGAIEPNKILSAN